jgi:hypothetical protein
MPFKQHPTDPDKVTYVKAEYATHKEFSQSLLVTKNELLKAELRDVAEQLRAGISKVQQKTLARAIEENLKEFK